MLSIIHILESLFYDSVTSLQNNTKKHFISFFFEIKSTDACIAPEYSLSDIRLYKSYGVAECEVVKS